MKIFQITTFFHPVAGGVETHVYDLSKELIKKGHTVEVLCSDSTKIGPRLKERHSNIAGIKVIRFRTLFSLSFYHKFFPGLFFYLLKNDFDVLHVHGFRKNESYIALFVGWLKRKKVVLTTHNPFPAAFRTSPQSFLIRLHDKTFGKWFSNKFYKIITLIPTEIDILIKKFQVEKKKLFTIPNALGDRFYEKGNPEIFFNDWSIDPTKWDGIVVSAGRINYEKGFQNLYKAVADLPKVLFIIAGGDDGYLDKLKALYAKCPNIIFTSHYLAAEKLINLYAAGNIFVMPSLSEAFGLVLLESLAQGTPVISTNVGGPSYFIKEEFGLLTDPNNQENWKKLINDLLFDKQRLKEMSTKAIEFAKEFKWEYQISKIINIYQ